MSPLLRACYRLLLHLFPPAYRRAHGDELEAHVAACVQAERARRGLLGRTLIPCIALADTLALALSVRRIARRDARRRRHAIAAPSPLAVHARSLFMIGHDFRLAWRQMRQQPAFSLLVILTLALGAGANTAIFSVVHGVLLKGLPFAQPDQLTEISMSNPARGWDSVGLSDADFWDFHDRTRTFEAIGALRGASLNLTGAGNDFPERIDAARVTTGFLGALQPAYVLGRGFAPGEDSPEHDTHVAVLSFDWWTSRFGADPTIVGRRLTFDGVPHTVIGVLPRGTPWLDSAEVFVPLVRVPDPQRGSFELAVVGRLKPGVSAERGLADLNQIARSLGEQFPRTNADLQARMRPASDWIASDTLRRALWILSGAVAFLLLIACVNVANLFLARLAPRARDAAVRAALGATRWQLVRQVLAESLLFALIGSAVGLLLAQGLIRLFTTIDPDSLPRLREVSINGLVLAFTLLTALLTSLVAGLMPALQVRRGDLQQVLRASDRHSKGHGRHARLRALLVTVEVAASIVLLVGAGLLARSMAEVLRAPRGFQSERRLLLAINTPASYDAARTGALLDGLLERARALPGVVSAAAVSGRPLGSSNTGLGIGVPERPDDGDVPWATWRLITPDYFKAMGVPLLKGRMYTSHDVNTGSTPRIVVSQRVADLLWPGADPIGRRIHLWKGQGGYVAEVMGVVGNMRERGLEENPTLAVYFPYHGTTWSPVQLVVHLAGSDAAGAAPAPTAATIVPLLRAGLAEIDPRLPISDVRTLDDLVSRSVASRRFTMLLLGALALVALTLACAGVAGVLAYAVSQRTAEIGLRLALGGSASRVMRLVIAQGMRPVLAGAALGLAGAFWLTRLMRGLLFGVTPADPLTYAAVAGLLTLVALAACYLPARRVLRVDPAVTLRSE